VVQRDLGELRVDVPDGGDANGLRDLLRRDAETGDLVLVRADLQFRTGQGAFRADVREDRRGAQPRFEKTYRVVQILFVGRKEVEGELALGAVVDLGDADVRDRANLGEQFLLDFPLRTGTALFLHLRQVGADQRQRAEALVDQRLHQ